MEEIAVVIGIAVVLAVGLLFGWVMFSGPTDLEVKCEYEHGQFINNSRGPDICLIDGVKTKIGKYDDR